jgi:lipid-A-disaccharide synthase
MAVVFPFESKCYQGEDIKVSYVGHPLIKKLKTAPKQQQARDQLGIDHHAKLVTLMPGSRRGEIDRLLTLLINSAEKLKQQHPELNFLLPLASTIDKQLIQQSLDKSKINIQIIEGQSIAAMSAADLVIAASGTATLEASLLEKPLIIVAKVSALTAMLLRRLVKVSYVGLCNLIADKRVVYEFLQQDATVENVTKEAIRLLDDETYRRNMINELKIIKQYLGEQDAAKKVADIALQMMHHH